jgi:hypothetical protein
MCCTILTIEELKKDAGPLCANWCAPGGCSIYATRPGVCREFECEWLSERDIPLALKPNRVGTILMIDPDSEQYQAVCDTKTPNAWRHPLVFKHLLAKAKEGHVVVAKVGLLSWRVYPSGECAPWAG